jgi:hypothetical protein
LSITTWNASGVTPVFLGNPQLPSTGVGEKILDIDKIAIPAFGESGPFQSPYYLRTPSRWNFDLSVIKNVALGGSKRLQLRVGFFNLFNQAVPVYFMGDVDFNLQTVCNVHVDGVPNGAGGTQDFVCDPTQGFHYTDDKTNPQDPDQRGHRVIELAARFTSEPWGVGPAQSPRSSHRCLERRPGNTAVTNPAAPDWLAGPSRRIPGLSLPPTCPPSPLL